MNFNLKFSLSIFLLFHLSFAKGQVESSIVFEDSEACLRYVMDENDNRIVDFSYAGYRNGEEEIPTVDVVATISPIAGDNTSAIQQVIDSVSDLTPDANGIRGAILLEAGTYEIHGTLQITASGVILRGVGNEEAPANNTVLIGIGNTPTERNIIEAGGLGLADWTGQVAGTLSPITSEFVPVGSRTIEIESPELYNSGDEVILFHPSTDTWLASIDYGATEIDAPWISGEIDIFYKRTITDVNVSNGKVTLDVPIYDHFENSLATAQIYKLSETDIKTNIGIENLRIVISTNGELTEDHARNAIQLRGVEDCWVSDVTGLHFTYAMVDMTVASRVTVQNCKGLQPHSLIDGARRYNFNVSRKSNNILFTNCEASEGRHSFISNGVSSASGIVFHNCTSDGDYTSSEGHRRWSQAMLFDNITFTNPNTNRLIGLYSRGSSGTGHGWSAVHSVAWNINMPSSSSTIIQRPPNRQNYGISCDGMVSGNGPFSQPTGYIENSGNEPLITSLYEKQLSNRLENGVAVDAPARFLVEKTDTDINISWLDIADDESGYVIEVAYDGTTFEELIEVAANETSYSFPTTQLLDETFYLRMYANSKTTCPSAYTYTYSNIEPTGFAEYFQGGSLISINTGSIAGMVTNFDLDTDCEVLLLSIADPNAAPLSAFNAYQFVGTDPNGNPLKNIEGIVNTTFRVSSREEMTFDVLFRSGEGLSTERSDRKSFTVPGGLDEWTEFTISWSETELDGFDPTDMRDMWFYLDRGEENFAGNELYIDHITIGIAPDMSQNSDCIFVSVPEIDNLSLGEIKVYPNPVTHFLTVEIGQPNNLKSMAYEVTNLLGQSVLTHKAINQTSFQIQLDGLETGIFYLNIFSYEQRIKSIKFIKL